MIAFIILVFVEAQDVSTPLAEALERAAADALGSGATVSIRPVDRATTHEALLAEGRQAGALAIARVSWAGARHVNARVELTIVATDHTVAEPLTFDESDPLPERGRALGLVVASLLKPETGRVSADERVAARAPDATAAVTSPVPAAARRWALDAAAEGGVALGGEGSGGGGTVGVRWLRYRRVGFRVGGRARFGEVAEAQAALMTFAVSAGVLLSLRDPGDARRLGVSLRADALLLYESLSHLSSDDPEPIRRGRLLPGAALLAEARWSLSPAVALMLAVGPEVAFGTTRVIVRQSEVAELARLRVTIQAGLVASY
jgi:hypothetical protein